MSKIIKRLKAQTPKWTKYAQSVLGVFALYNEAVIMYPELMNIIPADYQHQAAMCSGLAILLLQTINKKEDKSKYTGKL